MHRKPQVPSDEVVSECATPFSVAKQSRWGCTRVPSDEVVSECATPFSVAKQSRWGCTRVPSDEVVSECATPFSVAKQSRWGCTRGTERRSRLGMCNPIQRCRAIAVRRHAIPGAPGNRGAHDFTHAESQVQNCTNLGQKCPFRRCQVQKCTCFSEKSKDDADDPQKKCKKALRYRKLSFFNRNKYTLAPRHLDGMRWPCADVRKAQQKLPAIAGGAVP